ncbi:hypothetical protein V1508DRAFT_424408 [Lipomyces doorenjongii]|uniref:uncharacterized protein n=1 Tax=Lipomyces doorenjongii TaxID=383834 RepID=UPI0034CFFF8C
MPRTPPRHSGSSTPVITPPTPRYGPMFDPDHYSLLDRRQQKQQQDDQHAHRQRHRRRGSTEDTGLDDEGATRSRTRTRTISGAQPGAQMVTPRETPYRRRRQGEPDLATTEEVVEDESSNDGRRKGKYVARVLFPSTPGQTATEDDGLDEFEDIRMDRKLKFSIYKDPEPEFDVYEDAEDDPFVTRPGTAKKRSRQPDLSAGPDPSKKGMAFVFRGKKVFRPFPIEEQYSDDEFAIVPVKPRILFPQATADAEASLDSSQPTSSSAIFDDLGADSSSTDVSTQGSGCHKRDGGVAKYDLLHDGTVTRPTSCAADSGPPNPEEEETDIENYYST